MNESLLLPVEHFQRSANGGRRPSALSAPSVPSKAGAVLREMAAWLLLAVALWWLGSAGYVHAKAWLGQALLERAWAQTRQTQAAAKPWPWADTVPVARLSVSALGKEALILRGANGRTIAWGPGWREDSAFPGADENGGNSVIIAHRDTHFRFLKDVAVGEVIELDNARGETSRYRVWQTRVVDADFALPLATQESRLTLVTCYPFDVLARENRLRYLVEAVREDVGGAGSTEGVVAHGEVPDGSIRWSVISLP